MSKHRRSRSAGVVLALVLVATGILSAWWPTNTPSSLPVGLAVSSDVESSSLYCTGFTGAKGIAPADVVFLNTTSSSHVVNATLAGGKGPARHFNFRVPAQRTLTLTPATFGGSNFLGLSAIVHGAGLAAVVHGTLPGSSVTPCVSIGTMNWAASGLSTRVNFRAIVTILNPTASIATVNVTTLSPSGFAAPQAFQGVAIGPHGVVAVDLGTQIVNSKNVAVFVQALRGGNVVAAATQTWALHTTGASMTSGISRALSTSYFPNVATGQDSTSVLAVANPSPRPAHVTVDVTLAPYAITPFTFDVAAMSVVELPVSPTSRVPAAGSASLRVVATQPVVATLVSGSNSHEGQWLTSAALPSTIQLLYDDASVGFADATLVNTSSNGSNVQLELFRPNGTTSQLTLNISGGNVAVIAKNAVRKWTNGFVVITSDQTLAAAATFAGGLPGVLVQNGSGGR